MTIISMHMLRCVGETNQMMRKREHWYQKVASESPLSLSISSFSASSALPSAAISYLCVRGVYVSRLFCFLSAKSNQNPGEMEKCNNNPTHTYYNCTFEFRLCCSNPIQCNVSGIFLVFFFRIRFFGVFLLFSHGKFRNEIRAESVGIFIIYIYSHANMHIYCTIDNFALLIYNHVKYTFA